MLWFLQDIAGQYHLCQSFEMLPLAARRKMDREDEAVDIIIAVMGVTGAGKSTFISLLSDAEIKIGHGLQSRKHSIHHIYTTI